MINWNKLYKKIPKSFKIQKKTIKVIWVDKFINDSKQIGECDYDNNTITLMKTNNKKEMVETFFHEYLHFISDYKQLHITEKQVRGIEEHFQFLPLLLEKK